MEQKFYNMTKFDSMVTNSTMQLVKAVIPYIDSPIGKAMGVFIKFNELQYAINLSEKQFFTSNNDKPFDTKSFMDDIKNTMPKEQQQGFEELINTLEMLEMFKDMNIDDLDLDNIMNMMNND